MRLIKDFFATFVATLTPQDGTTYGFAGILLIVNKFCTNLIVPIVVLFIAIGQLRIQYVRYQREMLSLEILRVEMEDKKEDYAIKRGRRLK